MKVLICIGGPTASGKTKLAIELALTLGCEIISFDSRQVYRELNIGVAKPSIEELNAVRHHFIDHTSIIEPFNAAKFENEAITLLDSLFVDRDYMVAVGGTGLYINALLNGLDDIPDISSATESYIEAQYAEKGIAWLQNFILQNDSSYSLIADMNNPMRLLRASKIIHSSGKKYSDYRVGVPKKRNFSTLNYYLNPDRNQLYDKINQRVDVMMDKGLLEEVKGLMEYKSLKPLMTVGYSELSEHLDGVTGLEEAISKIKQNTRRYAKRQFTWFKNQGTWHPLNPDTLEQIIQSIIKDINDVEVHTKY